MFWTFDFTCITHLFVLNSSASMFLNNQCSFDAFPTLCYVMHIHAFPTLYIALLFFLNNQCRKKNTLTIWFYVLVLHIYIYIYINLGFVSRSPVCPWYLFYKFIFSFHLSYCILTSYLSVWSYSADLWYQSLMGK